VYRGKTFLAIIPARGRSKRLPGKNILNLAGKPLIAWSITSGIESKYIDRLLVSSDDMEIINISERYGADTIIRPDQLATDAAATFDTVKHALDNVKSYDYVVLLQPTSPLRSSCHIDSAIKTLYEKKCSAVISVCAMEHSPLWSNSLPEDGNLKNFFRKEMMNKRSQDLEDYYRLNGAIYICESEKLLEEGGFFLKEGAYAYKMSKASSIDIDDMYDFEMANFYLTQNK